MTLIKKIFYPTLVIYDVEETRKKGLPKQPERRISVESRHAFTEAN